MNNELGGVASEYLEITPEHIQTFGFDISTQIHPSLRNSKIWENLLDNDLWKTAPPDNLDELTLRPIFFSKDLAKFIDEPLNISRFLSDIAFSQKGLVYTIGDGYFIEKLVHKSVFRSVGILKGVHSTELLQSLAVNAFQEKTLQGLIAGSPLTSNQIKALTLSIIWPVWRDNCLENEKCLNFKLYFNDVTLKQNLSGAIIYTENGMDMKVSGDVHIGVHGKIISKGPIKFEVQGNWENLGMVDSEIAVNITAKNIVKVDRTTLEKEDL